MTTLVVLGQSSSTASKRAYRRDDDIRRFVNECIRDGLVRILRVQHVTAAEVAENFFDLRAPEKLRFGSEQPLYGPISPSEARSVPLQHCQPKDAFAMHRMGSGRYEIASADSAVSS